MPSAATDLSADAILRGWPRGLGLCALVSGVGRGVSVIGEPSRVTLEEALEASCVRAGDDLALPVHVASVAYEHGVTMEPSACAARAVRRLTDGQLVEKQVIAPIAQRVERGWVSGAGGEWTGFDAPALESREAPGGYRVGAFRSSTGRGHYERAVRATVEAIHAGDIFQANIAHRLVASFAGDARACFA
ncbi:MAG: hypothetical protein NXI14_13805, partial [bacterium]|nr:hypothetical protein [bacterium]